jgi:hypothetical protein
MEIGIGFALLGFGACCIAAAVNAAVRLQELRAEVRAARVPARPYIRLSQPGDQAVADALSGHPLPVARVVKGGRR